VKSDEGTSFSTTSPSGASTPSAPTMPSAPAVASSKPPQPPLKKDPVAKTQAPPVTPKAPVQPPASTASETDRTKPATRRFACVLTVHLDGKEYPPGAPIELTDEAAEQLLAVRAIEPPKKSV
jgi:hypothetical protein